MHVSPPSGPPTPSETDHPSRPLVAWDSPQPGHHFPGESCTSHISHVKTFKLRAYVKGDTTTTTLRPSLKLVTILPGLSPTWYLWEGAGSTQPSEEDTPRQRDAALIIQDCQMLRHSNNVGVF